MLQNFSRSWASVRGPEWLGQKLIPALSVFLASCLFLNRSVVAFWPALAMLVIALLPGAIYVSVLNDLTDRAQDRAAGKHNRFGDKPTGPAAGLLLATVGAGALVAYAWRDDGMLVAAYLSAWVAFGLYSLRPIRLKERGLGGVVADATGAHLLPALIAVLLTFRAADASVDADWLLAVLCWSGGYGLRGILWHQLMDLQQDRIAGVDTFVVRHGYRSAVRVARWAVFPIELAGICGMLILLAEPAVVAVLAAYLVVVTLKMRLVGTPYTIVETVPGYRLVLTEFYDCLMPLAVLGASALNHPPDLIALMVGAVFMMGQLARLVSEGCKLAAGMSRRLRATS